MFEKWADIKHELIPLIADHWAECNKDPREPFNIDEGHYDGLAQAKTLFITTARENEKLAGYVANVIFKNFNSKDVLVSFEMGWYVKPDFRNNGLGIRLLLQAVDDMKSLGVQKMYCAIPPDESLSPILKRFGWHKTETHYSKWI